MNAAPVARGHAATVGTMRQRACAFALRSASRRSSILVLLALARGASDARRSASVSRCWIGLQKSSTGVARTRFAP
jgi:hypothetical protein